jgi:RNA-directed DNA polymerase
VPPTGALSPPAAAWHPIDWYTVPRTVRRLQARLVQAGQGGRGGKVRALPHLLPHSLSGKAMAVKRVTSTDGKRTPGVDGVIGDTPEKKACAMLTLRPRADHAQPLRRLYSPQHGSTHRLRPRSMPTLPARAMQALYVLALDPSAETQGAPHSYGFRTARSTADAMGPGCTGRSQKHAAPWILEGDIRACGDGISQAWLLAHIPMDRVRLHQGLQSGCMDTRVLSPTEAGVPPGGMCSPVIAHLALDRLARFLKDH